MTICSEDKNYKVIRTFLAEEGIFEYLFYFCNRRGKNIREVQQTDFKLTKDATGRKCVRIQFMRQTNHRGDNISDMDDKDGRMYNVVKTLCIFLHQIFC